MIAALADRAIVLGLVAAFSFFAGWQINGWRLGEGIEQDRADSVTVVRVIERETQAIADTEGQKAYEELEKARRDAANALAAASGLRAEVGRFATRLATCNASTAAQREARERAAELLADVLGEMAADGAGMAETADSARARGYACERIYDGVKAARESPR